MYDPTLRKGRTSYTTLETPPTGLPWRNPTVPHVVLNAGAKPVLDDEEPMARQTPAGLLPRQLLAVALIPLARPRSPCPCKKIKAVAPTRHMLVYRSLSSHRGVPKKGSVTIERTAEYRRS